MIIDQLPALATAGDNDEIAIEVGTTTYKIKKSDFLKEFMPKTGGTFSGDITVNGGLIDVIKRRCYISPSTAGWYRVLELDNGSASSFMMASVGNTIVRVDIAVNNNYETHTIALRASSSSGPAFSEETSKASSTLKVNKIRFVKQDDNIKSYVDIYVDTSSAVNIGVSFDITTSRLDRQPMFSSVQTLTSVADSPSGETVLADYSFNRNGTGDINVNGTVTGQGFADLLFGAGTAIASSTDCNSLQAEGKYTCPTSTVGGTLSNAPYSSSFGMFVLRVAEATRLVQIAMPNSNTITVKIRYFNGTSWTAWKTLTPS